MCITLYFDPRTLALWCALNNYHFRCSPQLLVRPCQRGFIYTEHKPFGRPCLDVTHSFISSDAMRSHLSPLFASLEKGYLCIFQQTCNLSISSGLFCFVSKVATKQTFFLSVLVLAYNFNFDTCLKIFF
jgi:hypothetical protein